MVAKSARRPEPAEGNDTCASAPGTCPRSGQESPTPRTPRREGFGRLGAHRDPRQHRLDLSRVSGRRHRARPWGKRRRALGHDLVPARRRRPPVEDPVRTTAAVVDSPSGLVTIYGAVLPWHSDPGPNGGATAWSAHAPRDSCSVRGVAASRRNAPRHDSLRRGRLQQEHRTSPLLRDEAGPRSSAGRARRGRLECVTDTEHVHPGLLRHPVIDHVCLSRDAAQHARVVEAWEGTTDRGVRLSDHTGLVVELASSGASRQP